MGNLHLVTGYAGQQHVTSADHGSFNVALMGNGQFVLGKGNRLSASVITNNQIRVLDGDVYMQGRHIRLNEGTYVDLTIENGTQGYYRNDLIVARYTKDTISGIEECSLVVIKGTPVERNPVDPDYAIGNIIDDNAILNDMPLYRVPLGGLNVQELIPLFTVQESTLPALEANKVPKTRKINGKDLSKDINLTFEDVGATKKGEAYTKAETLSNTTRTDFGLGGDAVPNDVLACLGQYNHYWWKRIKDKTVMYTEKRNTISGVGVSAVVNVADDMANDPSSDLSCTIIASDKVIVDVATGAVSLGATTEYKLSVRSDYAVVCASGQLANDELRGKYITGVVGSPSVVFCVSENATFNFTMEVREVWDDLRGENIYINSQQITASNLEQISSERIEIPSESTFLHSTNRNAYPDSGSDANYTYECLGVPFANAVTVPKFAVGSYVGTGKHRSSKPNTLAFDFVPKFILVCKHDDSYPAAGGTKYSGFWFTGLALLMSFGKDETATTYKRPFTVDGTTVSWYNDTNADIQLNTEGTTYCYIAIG